MLTLLCHMQAVNKHTRYTEEHTGTQQGTQCVTFLACTDQNACLQSGLERSAIQVFRWFKCYISLASSFIQSPTTLIWIFYTETSCGILQCSLWLQAYKTSMFSTFSDAKLLYTALEVIKYVLSFKFCDFNLKHNVNCRRQSLSVCTETLGAASASEGRAGIR